MALFVCPLCSEEMFGLPNMADENEWYAKHHPDLQPGSVIPEICPDCGHDYAVEEQIVARDRSDKRIYTIKSLINRPNQPPLVSAAVAGECDRNFAVTKIRPYTRG